MEAPGASDLRRDFIRLHRTWLHKTVAIFRDFAIGEHRVDTQDRPISIGQATQVRYVEALEASDLRPDFDRDWITIAIRI